MLETLAKYLYEIFSTNINYYAEQQADGTYRKKRGLVTKTFLLKNLKNKGSIAIYQKNRDTSIKWICFDFDILKANLADSTRREIAEIELKKSIKNFCSVLKEKEIPFLLEFSGNRGFHVWITLSEIVSFKDGYDILNAMLACASLEYNTELIGIDLFPPNNAPTSGVGLGVKIPLSKHKKTNKYSYLLESPSEIDACRCYVNLEEELVIKNLRILKNNRSISKQDLERKLNIILDMPYDERVYKPRVKSILTFRRGFTLEELKSHWSKYPPLAMLCDKIFDKKMLSHNERKLIAGMFGNVETKDDLNFSNKILHSIFKETANYNYNKTQAAIRALSSYYFPLQSDIEVICNEKFNSELSITELIKACVPNYLGHEDATFSMSRFDINITRIAELNYILANDEVQSKYIMNDLSIRDDEDLLARTLARFQDPEGVKFYKHARNEGNKTRLLFTLEAPERILTSCMMKQLVYFLNFEPSINSQGYRINRGFSGGYIFEQWLYLWIKFLANISCAIEDDENANYYIVKVDIKGFYDNIPHDNIKRLLLGGVNDKIDAKCMSLKEHFLEDYKKIIDVIFAITKKMVKNDVGVPQGPAYARFLAEIYLDNIDTKFDEYLRNEKIYLYQRYVDDIFFIAKTENDAHKLINDLNGELQLLGLELNKDKTVVSKVRHFGEFFDRYRSQSKYAVDKVSNNFDNATETQQNQAISQFVKLLQSDKCEEDLAFIFSHLNGIVKTDKLKSSLIVPTLESGIGRGSVYKHIFTFVLENAEYFGLLTKIEKFSELQSEVLTSVFITTLESNKSQMPRLGELFSEIKPRLCLTDMVNEHVCYISIALKSRTVLDEVDPKSFIKILATLPSSERIDVNQEILSHINTELNNIKDLSLFTNVIYSLCSAESVDKDSLNALARIFYAKLSADEFNGLLSIETTPPTMTASTGSKFYYLLCLFSVSCVNKSVELLKGMWKYCAFVYNYYEIESTRYFTPNWLKKLNFIDIDNSKFQFIISSIVDGNIFRGLEDKCSIFERFHARLLIYIAFNDVNAQGVSIDDALSVLKEKAVFYEWLVDRKNVIIFSRIKRMV